MCAESKAEREGQCSRRQSLTNPGCLQKQKQKKCSIASFPKRAIFENLKIKIFKCLRSIRRPQGKLKCSFKIDWI
jgi:hypothetical protein